KPAFDYLVKAAPCCASVGAAAALAVYIEHVKVYQRMRCSMGSSGVSSRRFLELSTRRLSCATRGEEDYAMTPHVSIPAREPQHVAEVLAELMGGKCYPFGPLEGAFMAASGDAHGTMIEVYPERATLDIPKNDDQVVFGDNASPPETWPFHVLLS